MNKSPSEDPKQEFEKVGEFVSIFQRGKSWYVNYQHANQQVRRSLKTKSKKEARRRALVIEKEILAGEHKHQRRAPLISDLTRQYLELLRTEGRSRKTIAKYEYCFRIFMEVADSCRITRIDQISLRTIDQFRARRAAGDAQRRAGSAKTVHNDTVTIRQLVNFAARRGLIADDPLRGMKIKKPKRTPQPCWTREQVVKILEAAKPPHLAALIFLAETGTRVGEAKWLTWDDVDLDRRLIHIRPKDDWQPKSRDQRAVPMSDRLFALLSALPRQGRWVFPAQCTTRQPQEGRQSSERRLLQYLKRVLKRLGLQGHLHTFRHSFISHAAIQGVSERVLRTWIGHVDREILDWYFHLADEQSQAAMRRLSQSTNGKKHDSPTDGESAQSQHNHQEHQND